MNNFIRFVQLFLQKCFKTAIFVGLQASMVCVRVCHSISVRGWVVGVLGQKVT